MSPEQLAAGDGAAATSSPSARRLPVLSDYLSKRKRHLADLAHAPRPPLGCVSAATAAVLARALAFNPGDRWPTAHAFADALLATLEETE